MILCGSSSYTLPHCLVFFCYIGNTTYYVEVSTRIFTILQYRQKTARQLTRFGTEPLSVQHLPSFLMAVT